MNKDLLSACSPRYSTKRDETRETLGPALANTARLLGLPPMPWQKMVFDIIGELTPDGLPAYREVIYSTPRQSGKTTVDLSTTIQRAVGWCERLKCPQKMVYSAQTGGDARDKLLNDWAPLLKPVMKLFGIERIMRSNGHESIGFTNGSLLSLLASMEESGHGKELDLGMKDELFADTDYRRDQAMVPAMATREHAQLITGSTMGTPSSIAWNQKVAAGRAAAEAGKQNGIAYFEWSARLDDDPLDPATWWSCMPALGRTIGLPAVEHAISVMELGEFRRAWTNVPTVSAEQVIPQIVWDLVQSNTLIADPPAVFAVDVSPERDAGSIVMAKRGERPVLEVVEYRAGVGWIVDRASQLWEKYKVPFVLDANGPVGGFADDLEREGIPVVRLTPREVTNAAGRFFDRVLDETVWIRKHVELDHAVAGAVKRPSGDSWSWGRKSSRVDISLLMAATCALRQVDVPAAASGVSDFYVI